MIVPLELGKGSRCKFVCFFSYLLIKAFFFSFFKSGFRLHCEAGTLKENKTVAHINYSNGQKSDYLERLWLQIRSDPTNFQRTICQP